MDNRVAVLEDLTETLQNEVEQLRADVNRLTRRLARLDIGDTGSQASAVSVLDSPQASSQGNSYSVVSSTPLAPLDRVIEAVGERPVLSWEEREAICDRIGTWIRRSLAGHHRGSSGRDQIPLSSRVWIVAQDFYGNQFQTIRVFSSFGACRDLVKRGSSCGSSVFVGLPSEREARRVCLSAGLEWPR